MFEFLLFLAVLPTLILGYYIYSNDKIEKEPTPLLVKLSLGGVGSVIVTLLITFGVLYKIAPFFSISNTEALSPVSLAIYVFFGVALIEEFAKWIFLYGIAWKNKAFNHVYDAIVYSVFVSLGFATIENILYVFMSSNVAEAIIIAINRMLFSVPGHAFFGVMMGYNLGLAKLTFVNNKKNKTMKFLLLSLIVPTVCHFIFDYILMSSFIPTIFFYVFVVILFAYGISKVKRLSRIPTNIFNDPNNMTYIYNAFGNSQMFNNQQQNIQYNQNMQNGQNIQQPQQIMYCMNCGNPLNGPFCGKCGYKNY